MTVGPVSLSGQIPLERLVVELAHAKQLPIVVVVVCVMGSLATRVARWQVYFLPARRVALGPLLSTLSISYMASTFLPLRAGELVRPVFLGQRERIPIPRVFGTILLEKLFDFLAIGVMLALLVALTPSLPPTAVAAGTLIASVILLGFGFVVGLALWREPTLRLVRALEARLPFGLGDHVRLERAAAHFAEGTDSLREPRLWIPLLGWTLVTWLFAIGSIWAGVAALGAQPPFAALVFVTVATSATQAVPSSPGYVGVYHAAASEALKAFGVDPATALAIAVITHAFSYGSLVIVGLIALWTGGYTFDELLSSVRLRAASAATH
jgi:uncharacterized protein (TIRG00374 family)